MPLRSRCASGARHTGKRGGADAIGRSGGRPAHNRKRSRLCRSQLGRSWSGRCTKQDTTSPIPLLSNLARPRPRVTLGLAAAAAHRVIGVPAHVAWRIARSGLQKRSKRIGGHTNCRRTGFIIAFLLFSRSPRPEDNQTAALKAQLPATYLFGASGVCSFLR
jgi:hypothetical protein